MWGGGYTIKAQPGYLSYYWNNATSNDSLVVNTAGSYWCEVIINKVGSNLVYNGDFSIGDVGFTNSYTKSTGCFGDGYYDVRNSGQNCWSGAWSIASDHTGGSPGNFLLVNESSSGTYDWCQTITTTPGKTYLFEGWFATMAWNPNFILEVDNVAIGASGVIPNDNTWRRYGYSFVATSSSTNVCLRSNGTASDIGIDDLSIYEVCLYRDTFNVLNPIFLDTIVDSICSNETYFFNGNNINIAGFYNDTITSVTGPCDTIRILSLSIINTPVKYDSISGCDSIISPSGKFTWKTSGNYSDTVSSLLGCDTVIFIELTINKPTQNNINFENCDSLVSPSGKYTWYTSGTYGDTLTTVNGCDSILDIVYNRIECDNEIIIPQFISPNEDGINDEFYIKNLTVPNNLKIFNRWGNLVLEEENYRNTWKGKVSSGVTFNNNTFVPAGTYFYLLNHGNKTYNGYIHIRY